MPPRLNQIRGLAVEHALLQPPAPTVAPRQNAVAARRAYRARCMHVGKPHALARKRVAVRRGDGGVRVVLIDIAPTQVVGQNVHHVGLARRFARGAHHGGHAQHPRRRSQARAERAPIHCSCVHSNGLRWVERKSPTFEAINLYRGQLALVNAIFARRRHASAMRNQSTVVERPDAAKRTSGINVI